MPKVLSVWLLLACVTTGFAAQNFLVADAQTGKILLSKERDQKVQVASLTKIATAMLVLDWAQLTKAELGAMANVSSQALNAGGVNSIGLQANDSVSLRDLLYGALMASDNVAATVLAEHVGAKLPNTQGLPPIENFVSHMNALARTLGMKKTLFLNPTGFDGIEEGALPYSTVTDMARLTKYAYSEADFPFFVSQTTRVVHVLRGGTDLSVELRNTNELLGQEKIDGVKTGRTSKAGDCLILTANREPQVAREGDTVLITPRRIIVVLTGSRDRFGEGLALLRQGWAAYDDWAAKGRKLGSGQAL